MLKKVLFFAAIAGIIYSCNQTNERTTATADLVMISELVSEPLGFENAEVAFEGTITHICKHSGDKMRVNQLDDATYSIMVMLDEFQTQFSPEFEGKRVKVKGVLKTRIRNLDQIAENHDHDHAHDGESGHECASTEEAMKKLEEKGITPDIVAYIELTGYEVIEVAETTEQSENEESKEVAEAL
jgi:hypothetical protein